MEKATEAVSQGKVSVRHATLQFNVPKSTKGTGLADEFKLVL